MKLEKDTEERELKTKDKMTLMELETKTKEWRPHIIWNGNYEHEVARYWHKEWIQKNRNCTLKSRNIRIGTLHDTTEKWQLFTGKNQNFVIIILLPNEQS